MKSTSQTGGRVPELDGLRGLAILLVVFYHYIYGGFSLQDQSLPARFTHTVFSLAWSGVDLFFVLSGFLIGGMLMACRTTENYFATFYIRRFCRILPLYLLWLALFVLFSHVFLPRPPPDWYSTVFLREIPHFRPWEYFVFLQNFYIAKSGLYGSSWLAATWSLAVEEQFYLLLPLIIWCVPPRRLPTVLVSLILLVPALRISLYLFRPELTIYVLLPCRADSLLLGVLCACFVRNDNLLGWLQGARDWLYFTLAVLLLGFGCLTLFGARQGNPKLFASFEMASFGYSWVAAFYACLLLIVVTDKTGVIGAMMRLSWLRHFGLIAYGVFLMHMAVNNLVHGLLLRKESVCFDNFAAVMATLLALLVTWLLAVISWNFLEKPIINWGHSFLYSGKR